MANKIIGYTLTATFLTEKEIRMWNGEDIGEKLNEVFPDNNGFSLRLTPICTGEVGEDDE
ncbi:hypothetical protein AB1K91_17655 [Terribacillus sp. 179-K 1B1 HS]|uniref:hypothetical protein n=1 Tax=Terribacillus sp. 179-K 1B1 HS TaxID=3142388 RepID=UPI0039A1DB14